MKSNATGYRRYVEEIAPSLSNRWIVVAFASCPNLAKKLFVLGVARRQEEERKKKRKKKKTSVRGVVDGFDFFGRRNARQAAALKVVVPYIYI